METYHQQLQRMLLKIIAHFGAINRRTNLTPEDKATLKRFYLENFVTPRARKLLEKSFPGELP